MLIVNQTVLEGVQETEIETEIETETGIETEIEIETETEIEIEIQTETEIEIGTGTGTGTGTDTETETERVRKDLEIRVGITDMIDVLRVEADVPADAQVLKSVWIIKKTVVWTIWTWMTLTHVN